MSSRADTPKGLPAIQPEPGRRGHGGCAGAVGQAAKALHPKAGSAIN